ncbi:MAG: prolipoprotein diacylglyceryl transferase [Oscillospiraceae bacterium]|jgi:hypothetical protein|nr:prolipoprotein diacylglyceryl transferase [Oscillospiraceae bacterium]
MDIDIELCMQSYRDSANAIMNVFQNLNWFYFFLAVPIALLLCRSRRLSMQLSPVPAHRTVMELLSLYRPAAAKKMESTQGRLLFNNALTVRTWKGTVSVIKPQNFKQKLSLFRTNAAYFCDWLLYRADCFLRKESMQRTRLLPSPATGQTANSFLAILAFCLTGAGTILFEYIQHITSGQTLRNKLFADMTVPELLMLAADYILPLFIAFGAMLLFAMLRVNRFFYLDCSAVGFLFYMFIYKTVNCARKGCCFGIPFAWGIFNDTIDAVVFPVQFLEAGLCILAFIGCVLFMCCSRQYKPGRVCSLALGSFAALRFAAEYFRYHGENYRKAESYTFFGLNTIQWACVFALAVAIAWLFLMPTAGRIFDRIRLSAADAIGKLTGKKDTDQNKENKSARTRGRVHS